MTSQNYLNFLKEFFFPLLLLSVIIVAPSPFWTTSPVFSHEELASVKLGFPLAFTSFDFTQKYDPILFSREAGRGLPVAIGFGIGFSRLLTFAVVALISLPFYIYSIIIDTLVSGNFSLIGFGLPIIFWHIFLLNITLVFLVLATTFFFLYTLFPRTQKYFRFLSVKNIIAGIFLVLLFNFAGNFLVSSLGRVQRDSGVYAPLPGGSAGIIPQPHK